MEPVGKIALGVLNKARHARIHRQKTGISGRDGKEEGERRLGLNTGGEELRR